MLTVPLALLLTACDSQGPAERAGERIDESIEEAGDRIENATDDAGGALERAGDSIEETTD